MMQKKTLQHSIVLLVMYLCTTGILTLSGTQRVFACPFLAAGEASVPAGSSATVLINAANDLLTFSVGGVLTAFVVVDATTIRFTTSSVPGVYALTGTTQLGAPCGGAVSVTVTAAAVTPAGNASTQPPVTAPTKAHPTVTSAASNFSGGEVKTKISVGKIIDIFRLLVESFVAYPVSANSCKNACDAFNSNPNMTTAKNVNGICAML